MARFCGSVGPTDQRPCPCLGCGSYYARLGSHVDRCESCQERGLTKEIHLQMIKQYDSMHIVFQGHVGRGGKRDGTSWYVGYSDPRLVKENEESAIITVDNPLYDSGIYSRYPTNPERITILPSGLERVEKLRQEILQKRHEEEES